MSRKSKNSIIQNYRQLSWSREALRQRTALMAWWLSSIKTDKEPKHSLLKVKVWNDGHITYSGSIDAKDNEPVIVVGLKQQRWL